MLELNTGSCNRSWLPSLDLHEEDGELVLHADLRDFDGKDVAVSLDGGDLIVHAGDEPARSSRLPLPFPLQVLPALSRTSAEVLEVRIPIPDEDRFALGM